MKILIALPARNEEQNIGRVLYQIRTSYPEYSVLVVDDASRDRTADVVRSFAGVSLIRLPFWMGYGGALQAAYKYAFRNGFDAVIQLDADGQHDPASIRDLIEQMEFADLVVGSRFLNENKYKMPRVRRFGCHFLSFLGERLTGMRVTDPTSGFQGLNRKALGIAIQDYYPLDYPDLDVLILMNRFRLKVVEIPVNMLPSEGKTGMHVGLQVWYYAFKMILSILVMMLRKA
jgi:glycosyltransferase involved in cell wall biosynthesis